MPIDTTQLLNSKKETEILPDEVDLYSLTLPLYSLDKLIVPDSTLNGIRDFLAYQTHRNTVFEEWGLSNTHKDRKQISINLYGKSGTGKTMAAHAIAHTLKSPLIAVDYSEIESKYVGETSKNLTALFERAKDCNAIILFDEADAMLSRRVTNMSNSTDVSVNQTRSVLLSLMNDYQGLIIFTTNFIENYDPAFMRRILAHIHFELPDEQCRKRLWLQYIPTRLPHEVKIEDLAKISEGLSGSDISNCVLKSALSAAREGLSSVPLEKFTESINNFRHSQSAHQKN